jgi:FkbM family methyltransferase
MQYENKTELVSKVNELVGYVQEHGEVYLGMSGAKTRFTCFMGIGKIFSDELNLFQRAGYTVDFLCDNDPEKWGKAFFGYRCITPSELARYGEDVTVIVNVSNYEAICAQLRALGLKHVHPPYEWMRDECKKFGDLGWLEDTRRLMLDTLEILGDDLSRRTYFGVLANKLRVSRAEVDYPSLSTDDNEYFQDDIFRVSSRERFVDAGAYIGDTLQRLLSKTQGEIDKAFLFELDAGNFSKLQAYIATLPKPLQERIYAVNKGLWDRRQTVHYGGVNDGYSITEKIDGAYAVAEVEPLDEMLNGEEVTFIKMDIEGAEIPALAGAKQTIQNQRPKLAICTYHQLRDLLEIPSIIHAMCPDYRIFLRHHGQLRYGTICYATL